MSSSITTRLARATLCLVVCAACGPGGEGAPAVAVRHVDLDVEVTLPADPVGRLAPLPLELRWIPGPAFQALRGLRATVRFVDSGGRVRFRADHQLPAEGLQAGEPTEYLYLPFVPSHTPTGTYDVRIGLERPGEERARFSLSRSGVGGPGDAPRDQPSLEETHGISVGSIEIAPAAREQLPIYEHGWHRLEVDVGGEWSTWRWSMRNSTWIFIGAASRGTLCIWAQAPDASPADPQVLTVSLESQPLAQRSIDEPHDFVWTVPLESASLGRGALRFGLEITSPERPNVTAGDRRELGLRVFNLYLVPAGAPSSRLGSGRVSWGR